LASAPENNALLTRCSVDVKLGTMIGGILLFGASCAPRAGPSAPAITPEAPTEAIVGSHKARFFFPLAPRSVWEWYTAETTDNALEYQWAVEVQSSDKLYQCGFMLFKFPGGPSGRGDLRALLRVGQPSVWVTSRATDSRQITSLVRNARVAVNPEAGGLAVIVDDPETLRLLFSQRPSRVMFRSWMPGQAHTDREVAVQYREP
jgi:hypothetical protein